MPTTVGYPRRSGFPGALVRKKKRPYRRRRYNKRRYPKPTVNPFKRISGVSKMPYFKYSRCYDGTAIQLKASNHIAPGLWAQALMTDFNNIPGASVFKEIYRFFRIKKVITQYTPSLRSDEYNKMFAWPATVDGTIVQQNYNAKGGCLEIKHLKYYGYEGTPTTWEDVLNRAGKLKKCATTAPFRKVTYPVIKQMIADTVTTDPTRVIRAPWLSTEDPNSMTIDHYFGVDCWHTLNDISFDNSMPLHINQRFVIEIEFKGLKI
jgi:hypothetical protein